MKKKTSMKSTLVPPISLLHLKILLLPSLKSVEVFAVSSAAKLSENTKMNINTQVSLLLPLTVLTRSLSANMLSFLCANLKLMSKEVVNTLVRLNGLAGILAGLLEVY